MDNRKFISIIAQPEIAASTKIELDLNELRQNWGNDFNTLQITNTDTASPINIYLDNVKIAFVTANNGVFAFDWQFGIIYNFLSIENTNAGAAIAAESIKAFVGRTGKE